MAQPNFGRVFDYRTLRLLIGVIAFLLAPTTYWIAYYKSGIKITSISGSYHTASQDLFVGMLFIVGGFLLAYNGRTSPQKMSSKVAAAAAILVALFPTGCEQPCVTTVISPALAHELHLPQALDARSICETGQLAACWRPHWVSWVHYLAAGTLFGILAFFCLKPFQAYEPGEKRTAKKKTRRIIYRICGSTMLFALGGAVISNLIFPAWSDANAITFWAETAALEAFGIAWIVAGKWIPLLVDEDELLHFG